MAKKRQSKKVYGREAHCWREEMMPLLVAVHPRKDFGDPANLSSPRGFPHEERILSA